MRRKDIEELVGTDLLVVVTGNLFGRLLAGVPGHGPGPMRWRFECHGTATMSDEQLAAFERYEETISSASVLGPYDRAAVLEAHETARLERVAAQDLLEAEVASVLDSISAVEARIANDDRLALLVNNAGFGGYGPFVDLDPDLADRQIDLHLKALIRLTRAALPGMVARGWGRILTVGSVQQVKPHPRTLVYAASKEAQMSIVRNLAKQYASRGVTVNNLAPGFIATDRNTEAMANADYMEHLLTARIPAGVVGQPEDCAGAALLLCSEAGKYITGINLLVDGGMHL